MMFSLGEWLANGIDDREDCRKIRNTFGESVADKVMEAHQGFS
jgi:hypothetical protein